MNKLNPYNSDGMTRLLTRQEAMDRLRMPPSTFAFYLKRGDFLTKIKMGRRTYFDEVETETYINRMRQRVA